MTNERELLTLAAKAAGIEGEWSEAYGAIRVNTAPLRNFVIWDSLENDGDCARLEAALELDVIWYDDRMESRGAG